MLKNLDKLNITPKNINGNYVFSSSFQNFAAVLSDFYNQLKNGSSNSVYRKSTKTVNINMRKHTQVAKYKEALPTIPFYFLTYVIENLFHLNPLLLLCNSQECPF